MDKWIKRWKVPSDSSDSIYTVAVDYDGNFGCSCPQWKFRRRTGGDCKHIIRIKNGEIPIKVSAAPSHSAFPEKKITFHSTKVVVIENNPEVLQSVIDDIDAKLTAILSRNLK